MNTTHRPIDDQYDVVVVGARVAGASTALLLARAGLRVLLVDRSAPGTDTLSTHALMRTGVLQLHRWGILPAVVAAGTPPIRRTTFHYGDDQVRITLKPAYGIDSLVAPRRTVLDPILVAAAASAGVDVRYGTHVDGVERDDAQRICGVVLRGPTGRRERVHCGWVVGADGVRSVIADAVRSRTLRVASATSAALYAHVTGVETDGYEWLYRTGATAGLIPTNGGDTCVFVAAPPSHLSARSARERRTELRDLLSYVSPDAGRRVEAGGPLRGLRSFNGVHGYIREAWGPGWALVGDAGYFKDPLTAHGMSDALRDAELLARAIVAARDGEDEAVALTAYQQTRDRLSRRLFDVTERIASFAWETGSIPELLLELNSSMTEEVDHLAAIDASLSPA